MAWKENCPMTERTKFIGDYLKGIYTITELSESYNISRKTGYKWIARFERQVIVSINFSTLHPNRNITPIW